MPSSAAVGSTQPPYFSVLLHVLSFICGATFPKACTTVGRSVAVSAVLPTLIVILWLRIRRGFENQKWYYASWFLLILLSIGTLAFSVMVHRMTRMHLANRKDAHPSALKIVEKGIETKRIIRDENYDIYLPPPTTTGAHDQQETKTYPVAFFMLPGALVEHNVYAAVLSKISDAGILVVVQNCEPMRLASEYSFSTEQGIKALIDRIADKQGITAEKWSIGGHSLGGYTAMMIAKKTDFFVSLVMYGVNKNYEIEKTSIRALAVTASNDGLRHSQSADISTFECWEKSENKGRLFRVEIEGGNHSGFGDYPRQTFPLLDGERSIPLEEQHRQIVEATVKFLLPKQE